MDWHPPTEITNAPQHDLNSHPIATDCAVGAFARTFVAPVERQRTVLSTKQGGKKSKPLPLELLLIIFGLVYDDISSEHTAEEAEEFDDDGLSDNPEDLEGWSERDLASPSLFPYSLASVCSAWRDAMSFFPKFWKRVAIFIDLPATPISAIVSQLTWSRDLDLEVIVTQRDLHDTNKDPHGRSHMVSIMNVLCSHIHRIRTLRFDVVYSSSLPSFLTDFHGTATILEQLHLQCREDDGGPNMDTPVPLTTRDQFACPKLKTLTVDGRNYYQACRRDVRWTDKITTIHSLTVSHFNPRPGESLTTYGFMRPLIALVDLRTIHITNLVLRPSRAHLQLFRHLERVEILTLEDLHDFQVIGEIFSVVCRPLDLSLTRCTLGEAREDFSDRLTDGFGETSHLCLQDINQNLLLFLRFWHGSGLSVSNCPRFDDSILNMMSSEEHGAFMCAPFADVLHIHDCPNFSVSALRRLIQSRHMFHRPAFDDPLELVSMEFEYLRVSGNVPRLSKRDRAWFRANVVVFSCDGDEDFGVAGTHS